MPPRRRRPARARRVAPAGHGIGMAVPGRTGVPSPIQRVGMTCWMLAGVAMLIAVGVFVVLIARPLLIPVIVMVGAATIAEPLVERLATWHIPRALGAAAVCLLVLGVLVAVFVVFAVGIVSQWDPITRAATTAVDRARDLLASVPLGAQLVDQVSTVTAASGSSLAVGVFTQLSTGIAALATAVVGALLAVYILVIALAEAPRIHRLVAGWIPGPPGFGISVTERAADIARRYFYGLTLIAAMNSAVIIIGTLALHVPFVVAIGLLTFVAAYIPYLGAFLSGAFAVLMALGSGGISTALAMLGVVVLANAVLENLIRPFTFGAVLQLHPLVILLVTLFGAALAGAVGMMIAPPVAAIAADVVRRVHETRAAPASRHAVSGRSPLRKREG
jgi:predicted PurR-regulated permease PerM